jgi:DNA-binding PadR family transcriptional regulator
MVDTEELTVTEQQVLLAIMRLHPNAYGVGIRDEIRAQTGRDLSFGSIYAVLERLERRSLVSSRHGEPTATRGGRRKLYFTINGAGQKALRASLDALDSLRAGLGIEGAVA